MTVKRPAPREDLAGLRPYSPEKPPPGVLLHANESPEPPPDDVMEEIASGVRRMQLNRYPDMTPTELQRELAAYNEVPANWIWVGTGSNEVLLDACLAYGGPGRTALLFEPTYRMHYRQAQIAATSVEVAWRRDDFTIDTRSALAQIERLEPDIVFICSPNNPTGTFTPLDDLRDIAEAVPGLLLVDEAYYEFCGATFAADLEELPNTIVVRTLSKAFRLAGARIGYAIGQPETLAPLNIVRMPYSQSSFAQLAACVAVRRRDQMLLDVSLIVAQRDRIARTLSKLDEMTVFDSEANFVLFRHPQAPQLFRGLAERGIAVRDFTTLEGCEDCLRVTVGSRTDNDLFLDTVAELVASS